MLVAPPIQPKRSTAARLAVRRALAPTNLAFGTLLTFGWLALFNWTGTGPTGWQARQCVQSVGAARACDEVRWAKDQNRLAPYPASAGRAS